MDELVEYETKVIGNFLSKERFAYALPLTFIVLVGILILSNIYWHPEMYLSEYLKATPTLVFENGEYWRLFTSSLIHGDLSHFLSNSLMLSLMGYFVTAYYSWYIYPFLSVLMGGLINYSVLLSFNRDIAIVGASGIVYYLWGFWLILYLFIQRHIPLSRRFMKIAAIFLALLVPTSFAANISYLAHGIGFILGLLTGLLYFIVNRKFIFSLEKKIEVANFIPDIDYKI